MTSLKLGFRNLTRNRWRTALTLAAVAVAVALMIWTLSLYEGWAQEMVRGATTVETGQVQIHTAAYVDQPRPYRSFAADPELLDRILATPEVTALSPRIVVHGLVGDEERSQVVRILGVDPEMETRTTPLGEAVVEGRWLAADPPEFPAPREIVLGSGVARQLQAGIGDELVVFLEAADGSLGNELLRVVGIVRTANSRIDRMTVYLHLADAEFLAAMEGEVHEVTIRTESVERAREIAAAVAERLGAASRDELVVRPWQEILPAVEQMVVLFRGSSWIIYLLVYLLAAAGVVNTQRMSALERRREFGVMMAIGMRPRRMAHTLLVETGVLGMAGALVGAAGGTALSWYHATRGFDLRLLADEAAFTFMGVAFSERLHFVLTPSHVVEPVVIMILVAMVSGLWPALRAARIDPAPTIAGREA